MDTGQFLNRNALKFALAGMVAAVVIIALMGAGYAFSGSSEFCGSCHSMAESYASWEASNHSQFKCTDCHLPQDSVISNFIAKGQTGTNDTIHEILRDYPAEIRISAEGRDIVNGNCLRCHIGTVKNTFMATSGDNCLKCHSGLVHRLFKSKGGIKVE